MDGLDKTHISWWPPTAPDSTVHCLGIFQKPYLLPARNPSPSLQIAGFSFSRFTYVSLSTVDLVGRTLDRSEFKKSQRHWGFSSPSDAKMATLCKQPHSPAISNFNPSHSILPRTRFITVRCNHTPSQLSVEPSPVFTFVKSFAPATIANLGPGFDFLGCAVDGIGDTVTLRIDPIVHPGSLSISSIQSADVATSKKLSCDPRWNCAGIAGMAVMRMIGIRSVGLSMTLEKGLPLGSGLGSSAASAAAAAVAMNEIFGRPLSIRDLILAGLESEAKVSGHHADNIAPAIMGGFVLVRSYEPLDLMPLQFPAGTELFFVLVSPKFEAPTKKMRAVLPTEVGMKMHVANCSQAAALVAAVLQGDGRLLGSALSSDGIVEPSRIPLIPGMAAVKRAALEAGAFGCTISGAGPTAVAVTNNEEKGRVIGARMVKAFLEEGKLQASATVQRLDRVGARVVSSSSTS